MNVFLSTAFRYAKGQSDLPSVLPTRRSLDLAKEKSRKVRLFCKGLECFCEILYKEPVVSELFSYIMHMFVTNFDRMRTLLLLLLYRT